MDDREINILLEKGIYPCECHSPQLITTHISWVILCDKHVIKIKKPIKYPFLDFSTLKNRKRFCEKEVLLNKRLTEDVYIETVPISKKGNEFYIELKIPEAEIIDYAVLMNKINPDKRMDLLLAQRKVTLTDIHALVDRLVPFHKNAKEIHDSDFLSFNEKFNDILNINNKEYDLGTSINRIINESVDKSNHFLSNNENLLIRRQKEGFTRDCHGDLHSRNIFLLPEPVIFDCIEFNDDFRHIDILNELAFVCMDLEAFGCRELSYEFFSHYNKAFFVCRNEKELDLFEYYKAYRANVRAKVNLLRTKDINNSNARKSTLNDAIKYLKLMESYLNNISEQKSKEHHFEI